MRGESSVRQAVQRGVVAGVVASVSQVLVSKAEEKVFLRAGENADIGPRFVERRTHHAEAPRPGGARWMAAAGFDFGYAALWGALYALAHRQRPVAPLLGGTILGALIYAITFPSWGGAVVTGTEKALHRRSLRMEAVLATAAFTFGLGTSLLYGRGPGHAT